MLAQACQSDGNERKQGEEFPMRAVFSASWLRFCSVKSYKVEVVDYSFVFFSFFKCSVSIACASVRLVVTEAFLD